MRRGQICFRQCRQEIFSLFLDVQVAKDILLALGTFIEGMAKTILMRQGR